MKILKKMRRPAAAMLAMLLFGAIIASPFQPDTSSADELLPGKGGGMETADYLGEYQKHELLRGIGSVRVCDTEKNISAKYFYSDAYFTGTPSKYDPHLSSFAMNLCAATDNMANVAGIFKDCGFIDITANSGYQSLPSTDSIGAIYAHKTISDDGIDHNVVAVVLRGLDYGPEWSNNFKIGEKGDAAGFSESANKVISEVKSYISDNNLDVANSKFLITGYSRGAGVADLLAKMITDSFKTDVYGYCFATPNSASAESGLGNYANIHNIINKNDLITHVFMKKFNFGHYGATNDLTSMATPADVNKQFTKMGITRLYDDSLDVYVFNIFEFLFDMDNIKSKIKDVLKSKTTDDLNKGEGANKNKIVKDLFDVIANSNAIKKDTKVKITQEEFIEFSLDLLTSGLITSRARYATDVIDDSVTTETAICSIIDAFLTNSTDDNILEDITNSVEGAQIPRGEDLDSLIDPLIIGLDNSIYKNNHKDYYDKMWSIFGPTIKKNTTKKQYNAFKKAWPALVYDFCDILSYVISVEKMDYNMDFQKLLGTWIKSGKKIISNHYTETYLAFLRSGDDFYLREDEAAKERPLLKEKEGTLLLTSDDKDPVSGAAVTASAFSGDSGVFWILTGSIGGFIAGMACMYVFNKKKLSAKEK